MQLARRIKGGRWPPSLLDFLLGIAAFFALAAYCRAADDRLWLADAVVLGRSHVALLVDWLAAGRPAGVKLTVALSSFLGRAYTALSALHARAAALLFVTTRLSPASLLCVLAALAIPTGLSGQLSLAADVLHAVCAPVWVFGSAVAAVHGALTRAIVSLWRLFCGKKANPLRHRVDTFAYTLDELLLGTLAFAVALALWPTVAAFHFVLALLRGALAAVALLLTACSALIAACPTQGHDAHFSSSSSSVHLVVDESSGTVSFVRRPRPNLSSCVLDGIVDDLRRWKEAHPPSLFLKHLLIGSTLS